MVAESDNGFAMDSGAPVEEQAPRLIVVLDTDPGVRWSLERGLAASGYQVLVASNVGDALQALQNNTAAGMVLELLPEAGLTLDVLSELVDAGGGVRVVCASIDPAPQTVIECMRRGAADFVPKPFSLSEIRAVLARALRAEPEPRPAIKPRTTAGRASDSYIIGISQAIQELRETIRQVAQTDLNCLLRGESGTGKDMVAREIHRLSLRGDRSFVKVNCTALPEQLLESELFGYERGAFTGANTSKPGRFELAHRGIIFLDEIGDMHPNLQAKLLQVIEHKEFTKLGGRKAITVDVQIIAATNVDLEQRTKEGLFRPDLYFRLNEVSLWIPPLRGRREDIPLLVRHFLGKHGRFLGGAPFELTGDDFAALTSYDWPGNVRELESTIKRWLALGTKQLPGARGSVVHAVAPAPISMATVEAATAGSPPASAATPLLDDSLDPEAEAALLVQVLEQHQWNRRKAAVALGVSYQTLRRRIEKYGLDQPAT